MNNREAHFYLEELQRMMTQHRDIFTKEFVCANGMAIQALEHERKKNRLQQEIDGMNEEEIYDFLSWLMFEYAKQYTDSRSAVIKWLREGGAE